MIKRMLRMDQPGWGVQLEKLIKSGAITWDEAARQMQVMAKQKETAHETKRIKESMDEKPPASDALVLSKYVGDLKHVPRTGWVRRKVPERVESVAEHSFRAGVLGLFLKDDSLDVHKVVSMALVHDLAESIAGDIAPDQGISDEEKKRLEVNAMTSIFSKLQTPQAYKEIMDLWEEYEARSTPEGKVVKDLDRFEMVLQANEYEQLHSHLDLSEFFNSVRGKLTHPTVIGWFEDLEKNRNARRGTAASKGS